MKFSVCLVYFLLGEGDSPPTLLVVRQLLLFKKKLKTLFYLLVESCMEWVSAERIKEWIVSAKKCFEKIEWIPGME